MSLLLALLLAVPAFPARPSYSTQGEPEEQEEPAEEEQDEPDVEEEVPPPAKVPLTPFKHPAPAPQGERQEARPSASPAPQGGAPHRAEPEGEWQGVVDPAHALRPKEPPGRCSPKPPALSKLNLVIHNRPRPGKVVLDSTPIVCSGGDGEHARYCQDTMNDAARRCCPVRPEGDPMRGACEAAVMGYDPSDGRYGPRWYFKGNGHLEKHPDNPYLAFAFGTGTVMACSNVKPVVCMQIRVP